MLNAEAEPGWGSDDEDMAEIRPVKKSRVRSPSPQLDEDEEMIADLVGNEEHSAFPIHESDGPSHESDDVGHEEMGEDFDVAGNDFGGGMNNGVILLLSFMILDDI